jgi:chaperonin GroL
MELEQRELLFAESPKQIGLWLLGSLASVTFGLWVLFQRKAKPGYTSLDSASDPVWSMMSEHGDSPFVQKADAQKREITFDAEARAGMLRGINTVADAVGLTMGPRGRNVVLELDDDVYIINDGVSIARHISLTDPMENAGAQLIKEVAGRTNDSAGDGTTTASVLARAMIKRGLRAVATGHNAMSLKKGIEKAKDYVVAELKKNAIPIRGTEDVKHIAAISAGNDDEIGSMIAEAVDLVGGDGVLTIEDSSSTQTWIDIREGMEIDRGYIAQEFITNTDKSTVEFENPLILITDEKIEQMASLVPLLEQILAESERVGRKIPLVVVAPDVTKDALALLIVNKLKGVLPSVAIRAPGFGDRMAPLLQDLAIVCDGEYIAQDLGLSVAKTQLDQLGSCRKIIVRATDLTIIADQGNKEDIEWRVDQLKQELAGTDSVYDTLRISERIAKLAGGIAIINVGANTEAELEDRKLRVEDAKNATFAAIADGILPGGGTAFVKIAPGLQEIRDSIEDEDERMGVDLVMQAMPEPCRMIARNAGVEGEVVVERVREMTKFSEGYNAMTEQYEDLIVSGVIDPAKVTQNVFMNACSITSIMLTTQAIVTVVENDREAAKSSELVNF